MVCSIYLFWNPENILDKLRCQVEYHLTSTQGEDIRGLGMDACNNDHWLKSNEHYYNIIVFGEVLLLVKGTNSGCLVMCKPTGSWPSQFLEITYYTHFTLWNCWKKRTSCWSVPLHLSWSKIGFQPYCIM
jgi:hypothetical protein